MGYKACLNCEKRYVGCHAECETYLAERGKREAGREAAYKASISTSFLAVEALKAKKRSKRK